MDQGGADSQPAGGSSSSSVHATLDPNLELQNAFEQQSQLMGEKNLIEALQLTGKGTAQHAARHQSIMVLLAQNSVRVMELVNRASQQTPQALAAQASTDKVRTTDERFYSVVKHVSSQGSWKAFSGQAEAIYKNGGCPN